MDKSRAHPNAWIPPIRPSNFPFHCFPLLATVSTVQEFVRVEKEDTNQTMAASAATLLPSEYGYVALVLAVYCVVNFWMALQVGKARKKYKVFYPILYALESENKDAKLFNCVQRGHQNSLEYMPVFFATLLVGGLQHPRIASALGAFYVVTRIFYFLGYSTGEPKNRLKLGGLGFPCLLGLILCTASLGVHLVIRDTL